MSWIFFSSVDVTVVAAVAAEWTGADMDDEVDDDRHFDQLAAVPTVTLPGRQAGRPNPTWCSQPPPTLH